MLRFVFLGATGHEEVPLSSLGSHLLASLHSFIKIHGMCGNERVYACGTLREQTFLGNTTHAPSLYSITALGLLESVYFCNVLSMGQLPSQLVHPNGRASSLGVGNPPMTDWTHLYA
ncbi:hypothetical protein [Scytonema sp. PRP1]|uniref:hypothetical protein n=1 Tax=Scytonema sp. PRP1 TaxID=3120513 RepID=UPI002FD131B4